MADCISRASAIREFEELKRVMSQLRCELVREKDPNLFSDVSFKLDRVCTDFHMALRGPRAEPWKAVRDARRKIVDIQNQVVSAKESKCSISHGAEAGTRKEVTSNGKLL